MQQAQALAEISRLGCVVIATKPIKNLPNSAQLGGTPTIPLSYIWVCAECNEGQTDQPTA